MRVFEKPADMRQWSRERQAAGKSVGLVPTMGCLHRGHLSLVAEARKRSDAVAVSIFVNPTQFGPNEDFDKYPRDPARDAELCRGAGVDALFMPPPSAMYAPAASTSVIEERLSAGLCGARRPGHFRGVCTVVAKLFNIVLPDVAVFGQKDFQQAAVIRQMARDLDFPVEIVTAPTVREPDGLALSSRNAYLTPAERLRALGVSRALRSAAAALAGGAVEADTLRRAMAEELQRHGLRPDYTEIVNPASLDPVSEARPGDVALVAAYCGKTRLIDNLVL
ncbi:MAG: pantoate--beta-alanine ligase [Kiritimatiellae bacterium]|nr:pantoate--beta-alanine ligase [Kiritimatiellia bacterium]